MATPNQPAKGQMAAPNAPGPSTEPTFDQKVYMTQSFQSFLHNASITMLVAAPILISIPPRKLDLYTFALSGAFVASANRICKERTGAGLLHQLPGAKLPSYAQQYPSQSNAAPHPKRLLDDTAEQDNVRQSFDKHSLTTGARPPPPSIKAAAKDDWKRKRLAEEQEKLDQGEGYGGMIVDQIWDVWNQAEKQAENVKEIDQAVIEGKGKIVRAKEQEQQR
ncbi:hypothetical protein LTR64_003758 [Lithohypha guttulata]|uniref:uncharacterized protein n=1 Tax=Lithohypha guttulata TaxID=1690604 RepID=UPI002DDF1ECF|nr:hypothetical protein LTR51_000022 [Lithohypha guttulata]